MNRYIQANDAIHTPAKLKRAVSRSKSRRSLWGSSAAAVTAAAVMLALLFWPAPADDPGPSNTPMNPLNALIPQVGAAELIAEPVYPEMPPAPDHSKAWDEEAFDAWNDARQAQWALRPADDSALNDFYYDTAQEFLIDAGTENKLYSPLNLYLALGMLAEVTEGESRAQILEVLNCETIEELREFASALWNVNYCDDGVVTSRLASSLWLREDMEYNASTMQTLADTYYASSYSGEMGSDGMNKSFREWLNSSTGGILSDQIGSMELDADTVLALVSALYFEASWADSFLPSDTAEDLFHAPAGDITVEYLNQERECDYYWDDDFTAVSLSLAQSGNMWILLPDADSSVDALLSGNALELVMDPRSWTDKKSLEVDMSIPKFDVSSQTDLGKGLMDLGITDVFDWTKADFSPVCENSATLFLSSALHGARVMIDEEGCTGAAYIELGIDASADPGELDRVEFTADRPFLFAVTGLDGQILFLGVVNQP